MLEKIHALLNQYRDIISYLFFGVLTTLVNLVVYMPLYNILGLSATLSNAVAWIVCVIVSFLTNKPFVFHSHDWSRDVVVPEFAKFVGTRVGSGLLETVTLLVTVDVLAWNGNIMKLIVSVAVVIINYVGSKLIVFKK